MPGEDHVGSGCKFARYGGAGMPIAEITAALGAIKATTDVISGVMKADKALGEADLKFRLAEAAQTLLDARMAVMEAQSLIDERDREIVRLSDALEHKGRVVRRMSAYYDVGEDGKPVGHGYCMRCYEVDHKLRHLAYPGVALLDGDVTCPACKSKYKYGSVYELEG